MAEIELPNSEELKEARAESFSKRVALSTALFAVLLAIASLGGNNATKDMLIAQQQSSDQWAFYQSKVIRENLYKIEKMRVERELLERGDSMKPEAREKHETMLRKLNEEEARYGAEKKKIEEGAKGLERERDINRVKDPYFDYAEVLLQIAIAMASVSILAVSRPVYYFAIAFASAGGIMMINGYLLIFH